MSLVPVNLLKRALVDVSSLAAAGVSYPVEQRQTWIDEYGEALKDAERQQLEFVFESSRDLNSGRFHGSGMIAPLQMWVLRRRLQAKAAAS